MSARATAAALLLCLALVPADASSAEGLADPWETARLEVEKQVREDPRFRKFLPIDTRAERPWLVMAQRQKDPTRHATVNVLLNHSKVLRGVHGEFRRLLVEAGLPDPTTETLGSPVLAAFLFTDRPNFDDWHKAQGTSAELLHGIRAYISMDPRPLLLLYDTGAPTGIQDEDTGTTAFLGSMRLLMEVRRRHVTAEARKKDPGAAEVALHDPRVAILPRWFKSGFADLFGAADRVSSPAGEWRFLRPSRALLWEWGDPIKRKAENQWSLEELLAPLDAEAVTDIARQRWPDRWKEMGSLFSAESWGLSHFLLFGKEGAYRPRYLRMLREAVLTGGGPDLFDRCMEIGEGEARKKALDDLQKAWHAYIQELLRSAR